MNKLGDWTLEERIGVGGVADVWRARGPASERPVALKLLREPDRSAAHRARFLREGRLLQRLAFPGLPRCFEVRDGDQPFLVLELLEGETLAERIRSRGPLHPTLCARVAAALLRMLAVLHARGVVHRDVKSRNVYLEDDRRVLLLDLGLAADPGDPLATTLGDVMGTYAYMAPEQIAGAEVDHRCDLYSLGVTMYEALAGSRPFHASDAAGYLRAHRQGGAPPLASLVPEAPPRLVDTITRLMARDPAARPASATIAIAMLTGAGGTQRSLERPPMVGRAAVIGALHAVLDGRGTVLVQGDIGSGLGRVASQALELARTRDFETIAVRCYRQAHPLDPLHQVARSLSRISGPVDPDPDPLALAIAAQAAEGPLLLLVEAIEQCSAEALAGLQRIIRSAPELATLVTGVVIPSGLVGHRVALRPLTRDEIDELACGMLGTQTPPAGLMGRLHQLSGGQPAITVLALKELVARGALWYEGVSDEGEPVWRLDRSAPMEPTTGLARLFGDVLVALPPDAHALLDTLAVAGASLPVDLAIAVSGADPSGIGLGPLHQQGLIDREITEGEEWVRLRRPAVGALVLGHVPEPQQVAIHRRLASRLSERPRTLWRDERIAWHAAHAAEPAEAPAALMALGEQLASRGQYARALEVLSRASALPASSPRIAASLALARGEALAAVGRRDEAATALRAGCDLAREIADVSLTARGLAALAEVVQTTGDEVRALSLAEEALALLGETPGDPSLSRALLVAATAHRLAARTDEAAALYHQCIDVAMEQGQRAWAAMAHGGLGVLLADAGRLEDAVRHLEQEAAFLRARTLPSALIHTLDRVSQCHLRLGRPRRSLEALDEADQAARFAELSYEAALLRVGRARVHHAMGDRAGAIEQLRGARVALEPEAPVELRLAYRNLQGEVRLQSGDHQAALAAFQAAETEANRSGHLALGAYYLGMVGVLTADPDALTGAMEVLARTGDRSLTARLLLHGARVGGDAQVLQSAEHEARASRDRFTLLSVLHAVGSVEARREARALAEIIREGSPEHFYPTFDSLPAVAWASRDDTQDRPPD